VSDVADYSTTKFPFLAFTWDNPHGSDNPILRLKDPWWLFSGYSYKALTEDETIEDSDKYLLYLCTTGATGRTLLLPTAVDNKGRVVYARKVDSGVGTFTIDGEGAEAIDNGLTFIMDGEGQYWCGVCDGTGWETLWAYGEDLSYSSDSDVAAGGVARQTWYNPSGHELALTPGTWDVQYKVTVRGTETGSAWVMVKATLSTANNSESDADFTSGAQAQAEYMRFTAFGRKRLVITSNTTYYLNIWGDNADSANMVTLETNGSAIARTLIRARRIG
jgi:hypothetical protein